MGPDLHMAKRYARVAWWAFWAGVARALRLPVAEDWQDTASIAGFGCSLDFEPATVVGERALRELAYRHRDEVVPGSGVAIKPKAFGPRPVGFTCPHATITAGGDATLLSADAYCGCDMQPYYAHSR